MKNDIELQAMIGSLDRVNLDPKIREGLDKLVTELLAINKEFKDDLLEIKTNDLLTEKGKAAKTQENGDAILELLEPFRDAYDEHIESTQKKLFQDPNGEEKQPIELMMDQMRSMELRQMHNVSAMDQLQIESKLDEPGFMEAVLTSPKPLLPKKRIRELVRKKAEKENPKVAELLNNYDFSQGTVRSLVSKIESDIKSSGWKDMENPLNQQPEPAVDPVKEMAV